LSKSICKCFNIKDQTQGKGVGGRIWWEYYVLMHENGKMRPAETISGTGEEGDKGK
jgi:hypothetical protein